MTTLQLEYILHGTADLQVCLIPDLDDVGVVAFYRMMENDFNDRVSYCRVSVV
jgi:hypothetical protein